MYSFSFILTKPKLIHFGLQLANGVVTAYCEGKEQSVSHDRLEGVASLDSSSEPTFEWSKLWALLKPQLHYFLAAVAVSISNSY